MNQIKSKSGLKKKTRDGIVKPIEKEDIEKEDIEKEEVILEDVVKVGEKQIGKDEIEDDIDFGDDDIIVPKTELKPAIKTDIAPPLTEETSKPLPKKKKQVTPEPVQQTIPIEENKSIGIENINVIVDSLDNVSIIDILSSNENPDMSNMINNMLAIS
jgi:hypothetical protein